MARISKQTQQYITAVKNVIHSKFIYYNNKFIWIDNSPYLAYISQPDKILDLLKNYPFLELVEKYGAFIEYPLLKLKSEYEKS